MKKTKITKKYYLGIIMVFLFLFVLGINPVEAVTTYSDNLLDNGDYDYQVLEYSDEIVNWIGIFENEWCVNTTKDTGYLDINCSVYGPAISKFYYAKFNIGYNTIEKIETERSGIWLDANANEKFNLSYRFKDCLDEAVIIGWTDSGVIEIEKDVYESCSDEWAARDFDFTVPTGVDKIAFYFKHDDTHGFLDDVELRQFVSGCYDSDLTLGNDAKYNFGYKKNGTIKGVDYCDGNFLVEKNCQEDSRIWCKNGCQDGVCLRNQYNFKHPNSYLTSGDILAIDYLKSVNSRRSRSYDNLLEAVNNDMSYRVRNYPGEIWNSDDLNLCMEDCSMAENFALTYLLTKNEAYANKAIEILNIWSSESPDPMKEDSHLVTSSRIFGMILAADYLYDYSGWDKSDKERFLNWIQELVDKYKDYSFANNHESWRILFLISAAQLLEDPVLFDYTVEQWKWAIDEQLDTNGVMYHETAREEKGAWYTSFSQIPLTIAAEIARHNGIDLYSYEIDGKSLKLSIDWFSKYVSNASSWPYHSSPWGADAFQYEIFNNLFPQQNYTDVLDYRNYGASRKGWYPVPGTTLISGYSDVCRDFDGDGYYTNRLCGTVDRDDTDWNIKDFYPRQENTIYKNSIITAAGPGGGPHIRAFDIDGEFEYYPNNFFPYNESYRGGVNVATGDINGDGIDEIVVGVGTGEEPWVKVYDKNGIFISQFLAYSKNILGGVYVACGDLDGNGRDEIITGVPEGFGPHVRVFDGRDGSVTITAGFFAYDKWVRTGIRVASGDLDGDGVDEIVTGTGNGAGTHVRTFTGAGEAIFTPGFFVYGKSDRTGINVATGDVDGVGKEFIITGSGVGRSADVKIYDRYGNLKYNFTPYDTNYKQGVKVSSGDVDGDGVAEVATGTSQGGGPQVKLFEKNGLLLGNFFAYNEAFRGGVDVAIGDFAGN